MQTALEMALNRFAMRHAMALEAVQTLLLDVTFLLQEQESALTQQPGHSAVLAHQPLVQEANTALPATAAAAQLFVTAPVKAQAALEQTLTVTPVAIQPLPAVATLCVMALKTAQHVLPIALAVLSAQLTLIAMTQTH